MIDSRKLQYYTMAHRLRGYADGLDDNQSRQLIQMLRWSADMLEEAWNEYASDISQERVDETAKSEHEPLEQCSYPKCQATNGCVGVCSKGQPDLARVGEVGVWGDKREWVGLDDDIPDLGLVTEEFYNGMLCAEDILRRRNT
jgi:hypothetical protein